ncbi:MAG: sulfatase [Candidatus Aminicenantes bacterium]|nr:sulfatase [Candidatus Aminicenantes bacterium]
MNKPKKTPPTRGPACLRVLLAAALGALVLLPAARCRGPLGKKGIILVVLDSLRRDHLSHFGYERAVSPFLDGLMREGILFRNAYAAAPQTVPSVSSLITGLYPYRHGSHFFSEGQSYHPTRPVSDGGLPLVREDNLLLAEAFKEKGYRTAMATSNPGVRDIYGFAQGVEHYRYIDCFSESAAGFCDGLEVNKLLAEDILPKVEDDGFFIFLHYMDVHYPYYKPHSFRGRFMEFRGEPYYLNGPAPSLPEEDLAYSQACYDEGIAHQDEVLKDLFGILERSGRREDTLVVIVSDHGDEFLEHGGLGHGTTCYNELIHSFILLSNPRLAARSVETPVSLVDVFPTLLEWAGIRPPKNIDGVSLRRLLTGRGGAPSGKPRVFISELGDIKTLIDGSLKFIHHFKRETAELYDLDADPGEREDLSSRKREETVRSTAELRVLFRKMAVSYLEGRLDEKERQNLRSLGYIR